jgi:hypothetical protein
VCGVGVFCGAVWLLFRLKQQRKEARGERPPQPEKILRPAGWSALQRLDEVFDRLLNAALWGVAGAAMAGLVAGGFFPAVRAVVQGRLSIGQVEADPKFYLVILVAMLGVVSMVWATFWFLRVSRLVDEVRSWRFGLRGEQAVAEKLAERELAAAGYVVFHDLPAKRGGQGVECRPRGSWARRACSCWKQKFGRSVTRRATRRRRR